MDPTPPVLDGPAGPYARRRRRRSRPWLLLPALLVSACAPEPVPVIAGAGAQSFVNAIRLAIADDVAEHGPLPPFDTMFVVQASNRAAPSLRAAEELAAIPGMLVVIGHASSPASLASSQVYNRAGIVQIAPTSTAPLYSEAGAYSFRMVPPDDRQGAFLAAALPELVPDGGRIALHYVNDDYGRGLRTAFLAALDTARFETVLDLPHTEGDVAELDIDQHVEALAAVRPDAMVWLGRSPGLNVILPGVRAQLGAIPVIGSDGVSRAEIVGNLGPGWDGVRYADFVDLDATPDLRAFRRRYRERFGGDAGGAEVLSYDAARVVLSAVREGVREPDALRRHLASLGGEREAWSGLSGPVAFDDRGDREITFVLLRVSREGAP